MCEMFDSFFYFLDYMIQSKIIFQDYILEQIVPNPGDLIFEETAPSGLITFSRTHENLSAM